MQNKKLVIESNIEVARDAFLMRLAGEPDLTAAPGCFVDIAIPGYFLRRPISILDSGPEYIDIIYKVVGDGTEALSDMTQGDVLDCLTPLGNGFDADANSERPLLAAGGIGMPPIYALAKVLTSKGIRPKVALGFSTEADVLPTDGFNELGIKPLIAVGDTLVTDAMKRIEKDYDFDYVYCCGPTAMLKAVYELSPAGQFSLEERMGCGFGACRGCTIKTRNGYKSVCKDGPVFDINELAF